MTETAIWTILAVCIVAEVAATTLLTMSAGFSRPLYGIASLLLFSGCFWAMSHVLTRIPVGVAYAVWSGVGITLISLTGWIFLRQSLSVPQLLCVGLIVIGTVGLNMLGKAA